MKLEWNQDRSLTVAFTAEEAQFLTSLIDNVIRQHVPLSTPLPDHAPSASRVLLDDQRIAGLESQRREARTLHQNAVDAQQKLQSGVLPFRAQESAPMIPLKESPRTLAHQTGQFAGEPESAKKLRPKPGTSSAT